MRIMGYVIVAIIVGVPTIIVMGSFFTGQDAHWIMWLLWIACMFFGYATLDASERRVQSHKASCAMNDAINKISGDDDGE